MSGEIKVPKKKRKETPRYQKKKYRALLKKRLLKAIKRVVAFRDRARNHDPGYGWTYRVEGNKVILEADLTKEVRMSNSEKSYTIASSNGPYTLEAYGKPDHFVIAYAYRIRKIDERLDVEAIRQYIDSIPEYNKENTDV